MRTSRKLLASYKLLNFRFFCASFVTTASSNFEVVEDECKCTVPVLYFNMHCTGTVSYLTVPCTPTHVTTVLVRYTTLLVPVPYIPTVQCLLPQNKMHTVATSQCLLAIRAPLPVAPYGAPSTFFYMQKQAKYTSNHTRVLITSEQDFYCINQTPNCRHQFLNK